jgi:hypothetical protein
MLELKLLQRLDANVDDLPLRDISPSARNAAVEQGIHITKAGELRGDEPPPVKVDLSIEAMIRSFVAKGLPLYDADNNRISPEEAIASIKSRQLSAPSSPPNESSDVDTDGDIGK